MTSRRRSAAAFPSLRLRARSFGGRFALKASKSEYLVSNNPGLLEEDDILLSPGPGGDGGLRKAAEAFEAVILRQLMASMRQAKLGDDILGSSATDNFREMADARTADSLAAVVGANPDRPILIYCNNNFSNHRNPVPLKSAPLALNIQTFINLVGYGYPNILELADVVDFNDPKVEWVTG